MAAAVVVLDGSHVQTKVALQAPAGAAPALAIEFGFVMSGKFHVSAAVGAISSPAPATSLSTRSAKAWTFGPASVVAPGAIQPAGNVTSGSWLPPWVAPG